MNKFVEGVAARLRAIPGIYEVKVYETDRVVFRLKYSPFDYEYVSLAGACKIVRRGKV